jgi:hypothetical protein
MLRGRTFPPVAVFLGVQLAIACAAGCSVPRDDSSDDSGTGGVAAAGGGGGAGGAPGGGAGGNAAAPGGGGMTAGSGGTIPGTGGSPATGGTGAGGSTPGAGGSTPGAGGSTPGAGGSTPGAGGSTPGAGGSADAAIDVDAPVDAAPPSKCPPGALLCDGFDKPALDSSLWTPFTNGTSSWAIDPAKAARGTRSLRLHVAAGTMDAVGLAWNPNPASPMPNPTYVRFFLFLPQPTPHFVGAFVTLDNPQNQGVSVEWSDSVVSLESLGDLLASSTFGTGIFEPGRWVCVVMKVQTGPASELSLFVDGKSTPELTSELTGAPLFQRLMFAISPDGGQTQAADFWIDEVVLSQSPVGCAD